MKVSIVANGKRGSGKTTVLMICANALREAGYELAGITSRGEEVISEELVVTTAIEVTEVRWLNKKK